MSSEDNWKEALIAGSIAFSTREEEFDWNLDVTLHLIGWGFSICKDKPFIDLKIWLMFLRTSQAEMKRAVLSQSSRRKPLSTIN